MLSGSTSVLPLRALDQMLGGDNAVTAPAREVLTPREIAERSGFSYHAILRAIRRGDLDAFEPVPGRYRISIAEYERWLRTPARPVQFLDSSRPTQRRIRVSTAPPSAPGSLSRLDAIEARG